MQNKEKYSIDNVWQALGQLEHSDVVAESRDYARNYAETRKARLWKQMAGLWGGAAAALAIALIVAISPPPPSSGELVQTALGETRRIVLSDGTAVTLNSETELTYKFSDDKRRVQLIAGEAYFQIAKDSKRPFTVNAQEIDVKAIGTAFNVVSSPTEVKVLLMEGRIGIDLGNGFKEDAARTAADVIPGELITISLAQDTVEKSRPKQPDIALAWRQGLIYIDNLELIQALEEFNRYTPRKVKLADASLESSRISGVFRIGDTDAFTSALEAYFGLKSSAQSNSILLEKTK
jgi:transmembrane sensor